MRHLTEKDYKDLAERLYNILKDNRNIFGLSRMFMAPEETEKVLGFGEPLYATILNVRDYPAIVLHYGAEGDWTRAALIPESAFVKDEEGMYMEVMEAIEYFFFY